MYIGVKDKVPKYQLSNDLTIGSIFGANGFEFKIIGITKKYYKVKVIDDMTSTLRPEGIDHMHETLIGGPASDEDKCEKENFTPPY